MAIARAVVGERRLLLADEPSGALDSTNGEAVMQLIAKACHRGVAAVVVTHDAQLASWADRIVFLRDGRTVDHGAPPATDVAGHPDRPLVSTGRAPQPTSTKGDSMSTASHGSTADSRPVDGGVHARRVVVRWAWRLFRREWRQQFLIFALIIGRGRGDDRRLGRRHGQRTGEELRVRHRRVLRHVYEPERPRAE